MPYADASGLNLPLASGVLSNPGRPVEVDATLDLFVLDVHGLTTGDPVELRAEGSAGSMPAPLVEGVTYYAIVLSQSRFQVSETVGGAAVNLTTAGANLIATFPLPVDAALEFASRVIDEHLPAHVVPLAQESPIVRFTCLEIAAGYLSNRGGTQSEALAKIVDAGVKRIERWAKHVPVRGVDAPASLSVSAGGTGPNACAWRRYGGL